MQNGWKPACSFDAIDNFLVSKGSLVLDIYRSELTGPALSYARVAKINPAVKGNSKASGPSVEKPFSSRGSRIKIPAEVVQRVMRKHGAADWHFFGVTSFEKRIESVRATEWIRRNIGRNRSIFESGLRSQPHLLWLAQGGFMRLAGADISGPAVEAGKELAAYVGAPLDLWQDDSLILRDCPGSICSSP